MRATNAGRRRLPQNHPAALLADTVLRLALWWLGAAMAIGSRTMPRLRSQITRPLTFEIAAGERVVRQWVFDAQLRRIRTVGRRATAADHGVRFWSSGQALRRLSSPWAVDGIIADWHEGRAELVGRPSVLLWFSGLLRFFVKFGRAPGPRRQIPHAYVRHDPAACGAEVITVEPAVERLDPTWTAAWEARATLWMTRAAAGEPMPDL